MNHKEELIELPKVSKRPVSFNQSREKPTTGRLQRQEPLLPRQSSEFPVALPACYSVLSDSFDFIGKALSAKAKYAK